MERYKETERQAVPKGGYSGIRPGGLTYSIYRIKRGNKRHR